MFKNISIPGLLILSFFGMQLYGQSSFPVRFSFGQAYFPDNYEAAQKSNPAKEEITNGKYVRYIRSERLFSARERHTLNEAGVSVLEYIQFGVYLVSIPAAYDLGQLEKLQVKSILPVEPVWKLARNLREPPFGDWAVSGNRLVVNIRLYPHADMDDVADFCRQNGLEIRQTGAHAHFVQVLIPQDNIEDIAALPFVQYMELLPPPAEPEDTRGRSLHRSNLMDSDAPTGKKFNGEGVGVLVRDDGQLGPHIDFQGRLSNVTPRPPEAGTHGDGVAGILTGAGNLDPTKKGMAAGARLFAVDYTDDFQDETINLFLDENVTITNSSYSNGCNSGYTLTSQIVDEQLYFYPTLMHVFSAGNANGEDCGDNAYGAGNQWGNITGGHKQGKNSIATANLLANATLDNTSSRGPAYDGRIKPDISANGNGHTSTAPFNDYLVFGGTSGAAPGIAGCLAQLTHAFKSLHNGQEPSAALLKALILNSANDLGNPGPDFRFGWGHVNAGRALRLIEEARWSENSVDNGAAATQTLEIPAGVRQAKVMLYWPEVPAFELAAKALINDLDLTLTASDGTVYRPWKLDPTPDPVLLNTPAGKGRDSLNNMEQVAIDNPPAGSYTVTVNGTEVPFGPQSFFLVWEYLSDSITLTYPNGGEGFVPGETERIHWDAFGTVGNFVLNYSTDDGANWQLITTVNSTTRMYDWTVPNATSGKVRIQIQRENQSDTNNTAFSIAPIPQNIEITKACLDSLHISWTNVHDTLSYNVYLLGEKYMEIAGSSETNSAVIPIQDPHLEKWVSVRSATDAGLTGRRAIAVRWPGGLKNCPQPDDIAILEALTLAGDTIISCSATNRALAVRIENQGINTITGAVLNYQFDNQGIVSETLPDIEAGATLDFTFPEELELSGNQSADVQIWTSYPSDDYKYNDTLSAAVLFITEAVGTYFSENFEASSSLPNGWLINNPDASEDGFTWTLRTTGVTGANGANGRALFLDCYSYNNRGAEDYIYLTPIDLSNIPDPGLTFDLAHASYGPTYIEQLRVEVFPDCDLEGTPVVVWQKSDPALATTQSTTNRFFPDNAQDWRTEYVDLQQFAGQSLIVRFAAVNDFGNSIFVDNINLIEFNFETPDAAFTVTADSICRNDTLYFEAFSPLPGVNYAWNFGSGAAPITATGAGPHAVRYLLSGNKTPRLIAGNILGTDTAFSQVYVRPLPTANFTFQSNDLNVIFSNTSQNATTYLWDFGDGQTSTEANPTHVYAAPGNYTVKLSSTNDCSIVERTITVVLTSGLADLSEKIAVRILPNPTTGDFRVELDSRISGPVQLTLLDARGRLVKTIQTVVKQSVTVVSFENNSLVAGVYQLNILTNSGFQTFSVVVQ